MQDQNEHDAHGQNGQRAEPHGQTALDRHAAGRFARRQQVRMAQSLHDGLVEQHGDRGVQAALEQVERQEHRHEHRGDVGAGRVHVQRRDDIIPQQHEHGHKQRAAEQARNGAALRALFAVEQGGRARKGGGAEEVHHKADPARGADGQHLDERDDKRDAQCGQRPVEEAADGDDDVLRLIAEEQDDREAQQRDCDIGNGAQHGQNGQFFHFFVFHGCLLRKKYTRRIRSLG